MTLIIEPHPIPLRKGSDGTWRVGDSRVLLDLVIHAFNAGRTPEEIIQSYDTLNLEEVYSVISLYQKTLALSVVSNWQICEFLQHQLQKQNR